MNVRTVAQCFLFLSALLLFGCSDSGNPGGGANPPGAGTGTQSQATTPVSAELLKEIRIHEKDLESEFQRWVKDASVEEVIERLEKVRGLERQPGDIRARLNRLARNVWRPDFSSTDNDRELLTKLMDRVFGTPESRQKAREKQSPETRIIALEKGAEEKAARLRFAVMALAGPFAEGALHNQMSYLADMYPAAVKDRERNMDIGEDRKLFCAAFEKFLGIETPAATLVGRLQEIEKRALAKQAKEVAKVREKMTLLERAKIAVIHTRGPSGGYERPYYEFDFIFLREFNILGQQVDVRGYLDRLPDRKADIELSENAKQALKDAGYDGELKIKYKHGNKINEDGWVEKDYDFRHATVVVSGDKLSHYVDVENASKFQTQADKTIHVEADVKDIDGLATVDPSVGKISLVVHIEDNKPIIQTANLVEFYSGSYNTHVLVKTERGWWDSKSKAEIQKEKDRAATLAEIKIHEKDMDKDWEFWVKHAHPTHQLNRLEVFYFGKITGKDKMDDERAKSLAKAIWGAEFKFEGDTEALIAKIITTTFGTIENIKARREKETLEERIKNLEKAADEKAAWERKGKSHPRDILRYVSKMFPGVIKDIAPDDWMETFEAFFRIKKPADKIEERVQKISEHAVALQAQQVAKMRKEASLLERAQRAVIHSRNASGGYTIYEKAPDTPDDERAHDIPGTEYDVFGKELQKFTALGTVEHAMNIDLSDSVKKELARVGIEGKDIEFRLRSFLDVDEDGRLILNLDPKSLEFSVGVPNTDLSFSVDKETIGLSTLNLRTEVVLVEGELSTDIGGKKIYVGHIKGSFFVNSVRTGSRWVRDVWDSFETPELTEFFSGDFDKYELKKNAETKKWETVLRKKPE